MKRDGANTSLWQNKMPDYVPRSATFVNKDFDVIIVGGGITGVTTALLLQKAGKQCLIVESYNLCFGTTGGTTAHLNSFLDTSYYKIENDFGEKYLTYLNKHSKRFLSDNLLFIENNILKPTKKGKFLCDGIASDLFYLNLDI